MNSAHDHHDHHHHHHAVPSGRMLIIAVGLTLGFSGIEALGGWWSGSLALLGDAGHMLSDATALGLAAFAAWLAQRPPTAQHSYGLGRAEVLAAVINAIAMVVIVVGLVIAALQRFDQPQPIAGVPVMIIATIGLIINLGLAWLLSRGEQTLNVRGALLHVLGDILGSVAALISGLVVTMTGWTVIDPLLSLLICLLILASALRLLRDGMRILMEGVPAHLSLADVGHAMAGVATVKSVHDLHVWNVSSGRIALSAHVVIEDMRQWQDVMRQINSVLHDRFHITHTTLQPEPVERILRRMPWRPNGTVAEQSSSPS